MIELNVIEGNPLELNISGSDPVELDVVMPTGGGGEPTLQTKSVTYTPTESEQTDSVTPDVGYDGLSKVDVTVEAIDSEYIGSDVPRKSSSDLTESGATVTAPAGYYSASATKSVASGTEGTPIATKGAVSNHAVSVTPSVTNSAGYISGGTKTGSAVSVSASELVSGTKSISANGTEDVTNYASVSVSVPNSYSASDEGKVVDNGALVSQTSATYTENDTYDTTTINSVTVNVSGGGGISIDEVADGSITGDITITATYIRDAAFKGTNITGVTGTNVTRLREQIFSSCSLLTKISFPSATGTQSTQQFINCTALTDVNLPLLEKPGGNMFQGCTALEIVDFPAVNAMNVTRAFYGCSKLKTIILRYTGGVVSLNSDALTNTPFAGYGGLTGTVYVPSALIASYKTATNWITLYNGGTCNFSAIEGSIYE